MTFGEGGGKGMRLRPIQTDEKGKQDHVLYRIPIHYIKRHAFWVGQEGCGYSLGTGGMKGNGNQHPLVVPHPQWGLYQATLLLGRAGQLAIGSQTRDRFHP